jgi:filamentous hemagglutinin family protein
MPVRFVVVVVVLAWQAAVANAQVTAITPTGGVRDLGTTITQNGTTYDITGGTRSGSNLFHSFGSFSVGAGDIANFNNTAGLPTSNIVGRVTGGTSNIFGTIQTTNFPGTNLFLLNPAGWVFGPGASLNVSGAFHASTADYLRFGDVNGATFCVSACPAGGTDSLSVANPVAFGFLGPTGPISVQQSFLSVPEGAALSLVGGSVQIADSFLAAPAGRVQIGSFASAGEASVDGLNGAFANLGSIQVLNSMVTAAGTATAGGGSVLMRGGVIDLSAVSVDVSGAPPFDPTVGGTSNGSIVIRGGQIIVTGSSMTAISFANTPGPQVAIDLESTGDILLSGTGILVAPAANGEAGAIRVVTPSLSMQGASIASITAGGAAGPDVLVDVGRLNLAGGARISTEATAPAAPAGPGGDITVVATDSVTISGIGSGIVSITGSPESTALGGTITVSTPSLTLDGGGAISSISSGLASGGSMNLNVHDFALSGGAQVFSGSSFAPGGEIRLTATGSATIAGDGSGIVSKGADSVFGIVPAGTISVSAARLTVSELGVIQTGGLIDVAGNIDITATEGITIASGGKILSQSFSGDVGDVSISTPRLTMDNGLIQTTTIQSGSAGDILVNAGTLTMAGGSQIVASNSESGTGTGGNVTIAANDLSISGRSPGEPVSLFSRNVSSGIFSTADGFGPAGNITITANTVALSDGGTISARSTGTAEALAGNISIVFGKSFTLDHASITTDSLAADGGNVSIASTGSVLYLLDSQITTSVRSDVGSGGNITIGTAGHPLDSVALNGSEIRADAFGGPGGNINVFADVFLTTGSLLSASSALSAPGVIDIQANVTDVSGTLAQLPGDITQAATLLQASCAARLASGKTSSLVLAGREGVPPEPDGLLSSPLAAEIAAALAPASGGETEHVEVFPRRMARIALNSRCGWQ